MFRTAGPDKEKGPAEEARPRILVGRDGFAQSALADDQRMFRTAGPDKEKGPR